MIGTQDRWQKYSFGAGPLSKQKNMMERLGFLIGDWTLDYKIPESRLSEAATGTGMGTFRQALNDKYVYFDYSGSLTMGDAEVHRIFTWDRQVKAYRYWLFEDSGSFSEAASNFIDNDTRDQPKVVPYRRGGEARNDQ